MGGAAPVLWAPSCDCWPRIYVHLTEVTNGGSGEASPWISSDGDGTSGGDQSCVLSLITWRHHGGGRWFIAASEFWLRLCRHLFELFLEFC